MPAKPTAIQQKKPTTENAAAMFSQLFENMKGQTSWVTYINIQGQTGDFNLCRMLKSAFFMHAMATRQMFTHYTDVVNIKLGDLQKSLEDHKGFLVYAHQEAPYTPESANAAVEQLFLVGESTAVVLRKRSYDATDIYVLTFDRKFLEESIKKILNVKETDVQMETS